MTGQKPLLKMNKNKQNRCLYESELPILQCVLGTALALGLSFPALWVSANPILSYFLTVMVLSIIGWSLFLRKSYFYQDHVIVHYPFRFFKRQTRIQYDEINAFVFVGRSLEGEFLSIITKEDNTLRKLSVKYFCSSMVRTQNRHKRMSFFFFLKYLKSEGYLIKIIDYAPTYSEMRVESVFGLGNSGYVKKSPYERRKERKKNIIILIIAVLIGLLLGILYPVRSGK
jgi:hypothetical protein